MADQDRPLVTVVMPTYNCALYIDEAVRSVLGQSYRPLHLLISDDASTDGTTDIIRRYAQEFPDVIDAYFHPVNLGIAGNVASLYPRIRGRYECWFAGDDLYYEDKISRQLAAMQDKPDCVFSFHDVDVIDAAGTFLFRYNDDKLGQKVHSTNVPVNLLHYRCFISGLSIMIDREKAGPVRHRIEIGPCNDWLLFFELALRGEVLYIDRPLGAYRRHQTNVTRNAEIGWENAVFDFVDRHYPQYRDDVAKGRLALYLKYIFKYALRRKWRENAQTAAGFFKIARRNPKAILFVIRIFAAENKRQLRFLKKSRLSINHAR